MHFKILNIFSIYLVLYKFDMKSFKLIRNINHNVINYIFICGVEVRALIYDIIIMIGA